MLYLEHRKPDGSTIKSKETISVINAQKIEKELTNLKSEDVETVTVVSRNGIVMATMGILSEKMETCAAMVCAIFGAAEAATTENEKGLPTWIAIETKHGKLIIAGAGPKALLLIITNSKLVIEEFVPALEKSALAIKEIIR